MDNPNPQTSQPTVPPEIPVQEASTALPQAPVPPPIPPVHTSKPNTLYLIIAGVLCVGILIVSMLYLRSSSPEKTEPVATVSPTAIPTPTPPPNISRLASTSAFIAFSEEIASFSAVLDTFTLQDSTLAPPIMDTDLGLSN